jgi:hypothetical protein
MFLAVFDPTVPLIERPLLHEARVHPSTLLALGLQPYDVAVLCSSVPCRLVPEANVAAGQINVAESTLRALSAAAWCSHAPLQSPVVVALTALIAAVVPSTEPSCASAAGFPAAARRAEASTVRVVECCRPEAGFEAGAAAAVELWNATVAGQPPRRSLPKHLARVWRGLDVFVGCALLATVHGEVRCYRVIALEPLPGHHGSNGGKIGKIGESSGGSGGSDDPKTRWALGENTAVIVEAASVDRESNAFLSDNHGATLGFGGKNAATAVEGPAGRLGLARAPFAAALDELLGMLRLAVHSPHALDDRGLADRGDGRYAADGGGGATSRSGGGGGGLLLPRGALVAGPPGGGKSALAALLAAEAEAAGLGRGGGGLRVLRLSGLDLVLDPNPRALLRRARAAAHAPMALASEAPALASEAPVTGRGGVSSGRGLSLVVMDDLDGLLAAAGDGQGGGQGEDGDGSSSSSGGGGVGREERVALALFKAFLDDVAADQAAAADAEAAAVAEAAGSGGGGEASDGGLRASTPVVFVVGVGASGGGGGGSGGGRPGAAAGLLRVGRLERLVALPPPSEADRAAVCAALLRRIGHGAAGSSDGEEEEEEKDWALAWRVAAATPGCVNPKPTISLK